MALGCVIVFVLGLCIALYFEARVVAGPTQIEVPPPYVATAPVIDLHTVGARLQPPLNVRLIVTRAVIDGPLEDTDAVGYLAADTSNGLAAFPNDFEILGGKDTDLFDRAAPKEEQHANLVPTLELRQQIDKLLPTLKTQERRTYHLRIVARDTYGLYSTPSDISFSLIFGPAVAPPTSAPARETPAVPRMSDLERLAHDIARIVDQEGTSANHQAFLAALAEPERCGTYQTNVPFVASYRQAFDYARERLSAGNLQAFYDGVCDAWRRALNEQQRAASAAEAARNSAISQNQAAEFRNQFESAAAQVSRNLTLTVVGSALAAFLAVSLLLAFLAIESHSRATREAISRLIDMRDHASATPSQRSDT